MGRLLRLCTSANPGQALLDEYYGALIGDSAHLRRAEVDGFVDGLHDYCTPF